jgi:hypothetical protein
MVYSSALFRREITIKSREEEGDRERAGRERQGERDSKEHVLHTSGLGKCGLALSAQHHRRSNTHSTTDAASTQRLAIYKLYYFITVQMVLFHFF